MTASSSWVGSNPPVTQSEPEYDNSELQTVMPSRLKRYQSEGHYHFLTFSCRVPHPYIH